MDGKDAALKDCTDGELVEEEAAKDEELQLEHKQLETEICGAKGDETEIWAKAEILSQAFDWGV